MNIVIFDLDGTLADCRHRVHHIADYKNANWDAFYEECENDIPIVSTALMAHVLKSRGVTVGIVTGRSDSVEAETINWLARCEIDYDFMVMRKHGDHRPDVTIKKEWYDNYKHKLDIIAVFEDRKQVVDMWRSQGLICYQVAEGDF